jgi:TRAP-type transport system periplasmic protein
MTLTYSTPYSFTHAFSLADRDWIEYVERESEGRIHIRPYWAGVLTTADQSILELKYGVADIAYIAPIYALAGMNANKRYAGFFVTGNEHSVAEQAEILHCIRQRFPVFDEELSGVIPLAMQGGNLIHVLTRNRPIRSLEDFRGLRIRAPAELIPVVDAMGADATFMPMGDVYTALSRGVIDGVLTAPDTLSAMHFGEVANYYTLLVISRGAYPARAISERTLRRLPADERTLLLESGRYWEERLAHHITRVGESGLNHARETGMEIIEVDPEFQARFDAIYSETALASAQRLLDFGIDGPAIYEAVVELSDKAAGGELQSCR